MSSTPTVKPGRLRRDLVADPSTLKPGECARVGCAHDVDAHLPACTCLKCECPGFVNPDGTRKVEVAGSPNDPAMCTCDHLSVDHSAVGCHWCKCRKERR